MSNIIKSIGLAVLLVLLVAGCVKSGNKPAVTYLTVKGSDTMVHLASNWAERYMNDHSAVDISVTGGGSGTGIAALLNGTTDVCIASRSIKEKELVLAREQGIDPVEQPVARDGIAVVVNPANPLSELTIEQIGKIYKGAYTNWQQVGGPDQAIVVLSRESSSGTYVFFQERVLAKADYSGDALLMPSTSAIVQTVSQDNWAIGYVGLGYAVEAGEQVKMLAVIDKAGDPAVLPSLESVQSGAYPIARALYFYTAGQPKDLAQQFIAFCQSAAGQEIVVETGYVPAK